MNYNSEMIDEDELDLKSLFRVLARYKYKIIFITLLFILGAIVYAYFQINKYSVKSTIKVSIDEKESRNSKDLLTMAMSGIQSDIATEVEMLKSRALVGKVLTSVNFSHRYYTTRSYKEVELHDKSPFKVDLLKGHNISFKLYPIDKKRYRLSMDERRMSDGTILQYNKVHRYKEEVKTKYFHLNIAKIGDMNDASYRFVIFNDEKAISFAQSNLRVNQNSEGARVIEISYKDTIPARAMDFVNALSGLYISENVETKTKQAEYRLAFIDSQMKRISENIKKSAGKLEEFEKTKHSSKMSTKTETIVRQITIDEAKLAELNMQIRELDILYNQIKSGRDMELITMPSEIDNVQLSRYIRSLQEATLKKKILRASFTELSPQVVKVQKEIFQFQNIIKAAVKNSTLSLRNRMGLLKKIILEQKKRMDVLPTTERFYGQLQNEFLANKKTYAYLLEKRAESAIIKASTISNSRILDAALMPKFPVSPKRKMIVLIGSFLGLALGILLALLKNFMDDLIRSEDDVTKRVDIPVFGIIPSFKEKKDEIKVFSKPKSSIAESFRLLRTNLKFFKEGEGGQIVLVTSTVGGEGKTTASINLAAIISMTEKKVVILDLDMRRPSIHKKFRLDNTKGMSTLLSGEERLEDVIVQTEYENIDIIAAGPIPPNPSELIERKAMEKVLIELKRQYDTIIIDTAPIGLVTDARTLMNFSDVNIHVIKVNYSKKEYLKKNVKKLSKKNIPGYGILLNGIVLKGKEKKGFGYYKG